MLEEFITVALEAFSNANGDVDKFELQLRRKLMTYNTSITTLQKSIQTTQNAVPQIGIDKMEKVLSSMSDTDPLFTELENLDVSNMTDEDVIAFARRLGIMDQDENQQSETTDE